MNEQMLQKKLQKQAREECILINKITPLATEDRC